MASRRIVLNLIAALATTQAVSAQQPTPPTTTADSYAAPLSTDYATINVAGTSAMPAGYAPWWQKQVASPLSADDRPVDVSVSTLVSGALQYSAQIRTFSELPLIREQRITEECGLFDWRVFAESDFQSRSDPVGNTLTVGDPNEDRFQETDWQFLGGMRRRNYHGGQFEIAQEFGLRDNNSIFFRPDDQGSSRLRMRYIQPLKRGAGEYYNTSQIYLAKLDASAANDEFSRQLQSQVLEVARSYWALYVERASLLQRVKLTREGREIYDVLNQRRNLDVDQSQLYRAMSAVTERQAMLTRSQTAVRNAESRIIRLINDPSLEEDGLLELLPVAAPESQPVGVDMVQAKLTALNMRPEIAQARKQISGAARRRDIAVNELQPVLDAVLESYVAGLNGNYDISNSFGDQFTEGQPGFGVGLIYEYPVCNRTARARLRRRQLELRQLQSQLQATIESLMLEVEVAVREVQTSYAELQAKYLSMQASQAEVVAIRKRWEVLAGNDPSATLFLDNLIAAQNRLALSEHALAQTLATYNLSLISLARAKGTLLQEQRIDIMRNRSNCLPSLSAFQSELAINQQQLMPADEFDPVIVGDNPAIPQ
ncbi:TolC family protein [Stieleria sp. TO1_6]|uniref:TolC family protein n=1 Tax=Stieleria tagensis TaxID=2956795 RepID=UPI00209B5547|nr:TolC family protein [Stieleria tagensis]MCO8124319.1 TolC family protein [Stieleria tagensis]